MFTGFTIAGDPVDYVGAMYMGRRLPTQTELRQIYAAGKFQLISTELDLAITFCAVAATTNDQARSERNIANAERAYASAAYYLGGDLKVGQNSEIREKLTQLESLLTGIGRGIPRRTCLINAVPGNLN